MIPEDKLTLEIRLTLLERQFNDLVARVNKLEYASMRYGAPYQPSMPSPGFTPGTLPQWPIPGLPVTCDGSPTLGMENKQ